MASAKGTGNSSSQRNSDEIIARIAHLYYVLGMTQNEVAKRIGMTRFKVHRLLALAHERGFVRIEIDVPSAARFEIENNLLEAFGLDAAFVCPSEVTQTVTLNDVIGRYSASIVSGMIRDDMSIAISWGQTLRAMANVFEPELAQNITISSLLGSLSMRSSQDRFEAASVLAERLNAECYYIPAPILCDSIEATKVVVDQPIAKEAIRRSEIADLALVSIGGTTMSSLVQSGVLTTDQYQEVIDEGAIGNFVGRFIDKSGAVLNTRLNDLCVGLEPEKLKKIPTRILCAGGKNKVRAIAAVAQKKFINILITDENTAQALLELKRQNPNLE